MCCVMQGFQVVHTLVQRDRVHESEGTDGGTACAGLGAAHPESLSDACLGVPFIVLHASCLFN